MKPENILISATGHIKLVDFGSAARLAGGVVVSCRASLTAVHVATRVDSPLHMLRAQVYSPGLYSLAGCSVQQTRCLYESSSVVVAASGWWIYLTL